MDVDELIKGLTNALSDTPYLVALLLVGSTARGERHAKSDIDFLALIDDDVPWPMDVRDGGRRSWLDASGFEVEVGYTSIGRVRSRALAEAGTGLPYRLQLLTDGRVLAGGGPKYDRLRAEMVARYDAGPPPIDEHDRRWEGFDLWCKLRVIEGRLDNSAAATLLEFETFEHVVRLLFRLTRIWQPRTHDLPGRLKALDERIDLWAQQFITANDPRERLAILQLIATHVAGRYGLHLSGDYSSGARQDPLRG